MENLSKPNALVPQEIFSSVVPNPEETATHNIESDSAMSHEGFRNNTTAVEVIVKEVPNNKRKARITDEKLVSKLEINVGKLETELQKVNSKLQTTRVNFNVVIKELKRQVEEANKQELTSQTECLVLQLENEKLKMLLETKTNLLKKLKKEIMNMKRVLKLLMKGVCFVPKEQESAVSSDSEYREFDRSLKKAHVKFAEEMLNKTMGTYDTTNTEDNINSMLLVM